MRRPNEPSLSRRYRRRAARTVAAAVGLAARTLPDAALAREFERRMNRDPQWLPPDNVALGFGVNQRLRQLDDPTGGNRWLHHRWLGIFTEMWRDLDAAGLRPREPFTYVSMGAGTRNPYALALLVGLAGADEIWLVEPEKHRPGGWESLWGAQELVLRLLLEDVSIPEIPVERGRIERFVDSRRLFLAAPNSEPPWRERLHDVPRSLERADLPATSIDLLSSRSVLEHVEEWDACIETFARIMRPGGVMYHDIDLSAHDPRDPLALYRSSTPFGGLNERRLGDYLASFERAGFETTVVRTRRADESDLRSARVDERFGRYGLDDLLCTRAVLVARRTGSASGSSR